MAVKGSMERSRLIREIRMLNPRDWGLGYNAHTFKFEPDNGAIH